MNQIAEIEVFKTTITSRAEAERVTDILRTTYPYLKVNFDLSDCDNILRVESIRPLPKDEIMNIVRAARFKIEMLD